MASVKKSMGKTGATSAKNVICEHSYIPLQTLYLEVPIKKMVVIQLICQKCLTRIKMEPNDY